MPRNWLPIRGVVGGLLVAASVEHESSRLAVWDPARRRLVRMLAGDYPVAASASRVAYPDRTCETASEACVLRIVDLRDGSENVVALPQGYAGPVGEFTDDDSAVVLTLTDRMGEDRSQSVVVSVDSGNVLPLPGSTVVLANAATIAWIPTANAAVLAALSDDDTMLAVWRRSSSTIETVPGRFTGRWCLAVRPALLGIQPGWVSGRAGDAGATA
jgi:hypothetical protein